MLLPWPSADGGGDTIGFMPHFESLARGAWAEAAAAAGITLIDPRGDPAAIIAAIGACRLLLSEAMHGVIVADAMRVPWIALRPLASHASREVARLGRHAGPSDATFTGWPLRRCRSGCTRRRSPRHTPVAACWTARAQR